MTDRAALDSWLDRSQHVLDMVDRSYMEQWEPICWAQSSDSPNASASTRSCRDKPTTPAGLCDRHHSELFG